MCHTPASASAFLSLNLCPALCVCVPPSLLSGKTDAKRKQILVHKVFQLYARDLQPLATPKDMVRYGLRFAGKVVIHGLAALDVDISQAQLR